MCGGHLKPQYYRAFAQYLARSVEAYQAEGIDIMAITPQNEPEYHPNTYPTCIVLNSDTLELDYRFDYYMYGQFMKYIDRGAVRIASTASEKTPNVALRNPDGSIGLVIANPDKRAQPVSIRWRGLGLNQKLTSESIATLRWSPRNSRFEAEAQGLGEGQVFNPDPMGTGDH